MRIIVLSDIHGNLEALETVAARLPPSDRVIAAGDFCLDGPCPAQVWDRLQELGWELLMGNTDRDLVSPPTEMKRKKREVLDWTRDQLGEERLRGLAGLQFSIRAGERDAMLVVHANPKTMDEHLQPTMSEEELAPYLEGVDAEIIAFGHLHIPYIRPVAGYLLVDVSSVGHPKDLDLRSAYTIVEWTEGSRSVAQVRVPYNVDHAVHALRTCSMPHAEEEIESLLKASY
jgi:predicted phosphodiesterase